MDKWNFYQTQQEKIMKNQITHEFEINFKSILFLGLLALLPNLLGVINLPTPFGFSIHTFQYAIFIAAILYGPFGGAISGGIGSLFSSFVLQNPYMAIGNMLLGFMTGYFIQREIGIVQSVLLAFAIQIPWLYVTDVFLKGMPHAQVVTLLFALFISNILWITAAKYTYRPIKGMVL